MAHAHVHRQGSFHGEDGSHHHELHHQGSNIHGGLHHLSSCPASITGEDGLHHGVSFQHGAGFHHETANPEEEMDVDVHAGERATGTGTRKYAGLGYVSVDKQYDPDEEDDDDPDFDWTLLEDAPPLDPGEVEASLVVQAVCWMKEANLGMHPENGRANFQTRRQVEAYKRMKGTLPWFNLCNAAFLLLAFLEEPPWCSGPTCPHSPDIPRLIYNSIHPLILIFFEIGLLLVYAYRIWLNSQIFNHDRDRLLDGWRWFSLLSVSLSILACSASIVVLPLFGHYTTFHRLLRIPIFVSFTRGLRMTLQRVVRSLPAIVDACTMLFLCSLLFSWAGMVVFGYTPGGVSFPTMVHSLKHMYVLITTNDMPEIMLKAIATSPLHGLFYVIFLVLSVFLLMNVLLADIYDRYKGLLQDSIVDFYKKRAASIQMAYRLLQEYEGGHAGIGQETLAAFLQELIGDGSRADGVLDILDDDESGKIEGEEFKMVAEVLADPAFTPVADGGGIEWLEPAEPYVEKLDQFCDYFSVLAATLVMWQTTVFAQSSSLGMGVDILCHQHSIINVVVFLISMIYAVELFFEIAINGWAKFMASDPFQNNFDLITVCVMAPLELWFFVLGGVGAPPSACRVLTLLRGMRCLRMLHKLPGPRDLLVKVYNGMEAFVKVLLLLFCACFFYGQVGMLTMGGRVTKKEDAIVGTGYDTSDFWCLNFNDMTSALLLLFSHLVGNNDNNWANAFSSAFGQWVWFFFFIFDLLSNFIILNIIVALVIDCVMVPLPEQPEGEEWKWPDREDQIRAMFADSGYPELKELDESQKENRQQLRELFGAG